MVLGETAASALSFEDLIDDSYLGAPVKDKITEAATDRVVALERPQASDALESWS